MMELEEEWLAGLEGGQAIAHARLPEVRFFRFQLL